MVCDFDMGVLLPGIEVTIHVVVVHMNDSSFYFDVHRLFIRKSMITPLCEETVETFAESVTNHVSSAVLVFACDLILFVSGECLRVGDGNINFIVKSTSCELML